MDRTQLLSQLLNHFPIPGETVYLQRRGEEYDWSYLDPGSPLPVPGGSGGSGGAPDAWLFYSGTWPEQNPEQLAAHLDDLLAEMESMCGGPERCRWPLDQPYPLHH
jgi:hypothetical protein